MQKEAELGKAASGGFVEAAWCMDDRRQVNDSGSGISSEIPGQCIRRRTIDSNSGTCLCCSRGLGAEEEASAGDAKPTAMLVVFKAPWWSARLVEPAIAATCL